MARQIIKLTESDLHRIIKNAARKAIMLEAEENDWRDSYNKWADRIQTDRDEGVALNKKWNDELKSQYPDKKERRKALNKHMKARDKEKGKTSDKPYWRKYDADMDESIIRGAVRESINKVLKKGLGRI